MSMYSLDGMVGGRRESAGSVIVDGPSALRSLNPGLRDGPPGLRRAICMSVECSALDEWV